MTIWFTSDNHFSHVRIMEFCPNTRKGKDVHEMNRLMIRKWQEQVQPDDEVWTLGDVFFGNVSEAENIMRQLPGHKHMLWGNHDKNVSRSEVIRNQFESIQDYKELKIGGQNVVLFHFPIYEWNRMHGGAFHFFGHVHGNQTIPGRAIDVGIDGELATGEMRLFSWEELHAHLIKKDVRTHHGKNNIL